MMAYKIPNIISGLIRKLSWFLVIKCMKTIIAYINERAELIIKMMLLSVERKLSISIRHEKIEFT
jgi:hypothetical protein